MVVTLVVSGVTVTLSNTGSKPPTAAICRGFQKTNQFAADRSSDMKKTQESLPGERVFHGALLETLQAQHLRYRALACLGAVMIHWLRMTPRR